MTGFTRCAIIPTWTGPQKTTASSVDLEAQEVQ